VWTTYVLAILAAVFVAAGSVLEAHSASSAPPEDVLSPKLLVWLVQRPIWLGGVAGSVVGNVLKAVAVGIGSVPVVQAVLTVRLLFALPMAAAWGRHSVALRDWAGAGAIVAGLVGFLVVEAPGRASQHVPDLRWAYGGGAIAIFVLAATLVGRKLGPTRKAPLLATAGAAMFGLQASLTHTAIRVLTHSGVLGLLTTWSGYAVIAAAVLGMILVQSAYATAPFAAAYPALVATELLAGIGIAAGVLGASIRLAPLNLALGLLCLLVMVAGVYVLTTSPLVTGELDRLRRRHEEAMALRTEAEEARDLRRAHRDLERLEEHLADGRMRRRDRTELDEHMDRVAGEIERLEELQVNIRKHRDAERGRPATSRGSSRAEQETEDLELAERENEISERADWLREQARGLRERIGSVIWVEE
jgi:hypothetical protein